MSCLRTRSKEELFAMTKDLTDKNYSWEIHSIPTSFGFIITALLGIPKKEII
jgi:hypothetical protein